MTPDQAWAAIVLADTPDVCASVMRNRPVRVAQLDPFFLRRGLRGYEPADRDSYILVTLDILDAIAEAGPRTDDDKAPRAGAPAPEQRHVEPPGPPSITPPRIYAPR